MENTDQHLLEPPAAELVPASYGKRFINYAVDFTIYIFIAVFLILITAPVYPLAGKILNKQPLGLADQLLINFMYGLYMSLMEAVLKGKTIGKYITGTRAVTTAGYPINGQTAFSRGLIRVIPFPLEQISAFRFSFTPFGLWPPSPWHDRWSKSIVVDEAKSKLPKA